MRKQVKVVRAEFSIKAGKSMQLCWCTKTAEKKKH